MNKVIIFTIIALLFVSLTYLSFANAVNTRPITVKFRMKYHIGDSRTNDNFTIGNTTSFSLSTDNFLEGELIGQKAERFGEDIKAVTHHSLEINQNKTRTWEAIVLFDI
jgi:hypothetical protein